MSITHCRSAKLASRSLEMSGSATLTMVTSISNIRVPRHTAVSGIHFAAGRPPFSAIEKCCAAGQHQLLLTLGRPGQQGAQDDVADRAGCGRVQPAEVADTAGAHGQ